MIKVRSKTLFIPAEEQSIGAVGEADSTVREFHIDRVSGDGVDLANLLFKLNIRYAGVRDIDRSDLEKVITDDEIILRWLISSVTMSHAGTAFIQLDAFDNTGSCRWKSYPCAVYIEKSIDGTVPQNTLTELEQLEKKFSTVNALEEERKTAEEKRVAAEEKREEAEGRRNTSLSNIVAEEAKIVALSKETKGYRDSVASDKTSVEAVKANVQELKADTENIKTSTLSAVETVKTEINRDMATAKNEVNSTITGAKAELNSTISTAKIDLGSMVSEGTKIKGEISTLKSEVNTVKEEAINAKTEAINAKNEAVTEKNGASTIKEEVTAIKVEISASAEKAKQNADKAESSANTAKTAETNAEAFKTEAGKSADKAKESETKTLEALAKAQEGGKVAGVTTEEMKSYVDNAVSNVHSGLSEEEVQAKIDSNKITNNPTLTPESVALNLGHPDGYPIAFGIDQLATGRSLAIFLNGIKKRNKEINSKPYRNIADLYQIYPNNTVNVLKEINKRIREDNYGDIRLGDYINVKLNGLDKTMKFVAVGIDFYKGIKSYRDSENPSQIWLEKVPLKHIDFVCIDTDLTLGLNPEDTEPSATFPSETRCFVSILVCKTLLKDLKKDNLDFFNELAYKPCFDWPQSFSLGDKPYTFMTHLPLWVPTPEEVTGKYMTFKNDGNISIDSSKMALQYPYFAEHPEVFDTGCSRDSKFKLFSCSYEEKVAVHIINGYFIGMPATKVFENVKGSGQIYIPLGFRLDGKQSNGSIIPPA